MLYGKVRVMNERMLVIKVNIIFLLRWLGLIKNVWYKSDIELADIRAKELAAFFHEEHAEVDDFVVTQQVIDDLPAILKRG